MTQQSVENVQSTDDFTNPREPVEPDKPLIYSLMPASFEQGKPANQNPQKEDVTGLRQEVASIQSGKSETKPNTWDHAAALYRLAGAELTAGNYQNAEKAFNASMAVSTKLVASEKKGNQSKARNFVVDMIKHYGADLGKMADNDPQHEYEIRQINDGVYAALMDFSKFPRALTSREMGMLRVDKDGKALPNQDILGPIIEDEKIALLQSRAGNMMLMANRGLEFKRINNEEFRDKVGKAIDYLTSAADALKKLEGNSYKDSLAKTLVDLAQAEEARALKGNNPQTDPEIKSAAVHYDESIKTLESIQGGAGTLKRDRDLITVCESYGRMLGKLGILNPQKEAELVEKIEAARRRIFERERKDRPKPITVI